MNSQSSMTSQRVSDLVDGYLPGDTDEQTWDHLLSDPQSVQTWHAYHVVGDVLRNAELAPSRRDLAFLAKFEQRLALEPGRPVVHAAGSATVDADVDRASANASVFRWKMLAGLACTALMGVVVVGQWSQPGQQPGAQMALRPPVPPLETPVVTADNGAGPMLRDARLDELMAAHRQLGGHSALQVPAGFLRNATYEGPAR